MGTRSLTYVYAGKYNEADVPLINMYRQYDGYPAGHGLELAQFLNSGKLVNGLGANEDDSIRLFNGMTCLAGRMVTYFKGDDAGNVYLNTPVVGINCWQEYEYHVWEDRVQVIEGQMRGGRIIFDNDWNEFLTWTKDYA